MTLSNFLVMARSNRTAVPAADILSFLLCESNTYKDCFPHSKPGGELITMRRAPLPLRTCWQLLIISMIDVIYAPAVISSVLFSRKSTFINVFSQKLMW